MRGHPPFRKARQAVLCPFPGCAGKPERFYETFHDDGQTDMAVAVRTYLEAGFEGPVRVDHVPTLAGEENGQPGYTDLGRLYALGYLRGLLDACIGKTDEISQGRRF